MKQVLNYNLKFPKEVPPDGLLLWRLVGYSNIILANGDQWKRHSQIVKAALNRTVPVGEFANLANRLFRSMKNGGRFKFDELAMVRPLLNPNHKHL